MDINPSADRSSSPAPRPTLLVLVDIAISSAWLFFPNLLMGMGAARVMFMANKSLPHPWNEDWLALCATFDATTYLLIGGANLILVIIWLTARRFLILPLYGVFHYAATMPPAVVAQGAPARWSIGHLTTDIVRITQLAREYYYRHQSAQEALTQVRALLAEIAARQHTMVESACRSMMVHYQSVLTYANYLEEQVARHAVDPSVRYDFDEVSESGFNLTLIARALSLYASNDSPIPMQVNLAQLMQQTMLSLSTSLDRRSMKLTTAEVDLEVAAHCEPITLTHVLWMLLLGTIRYAADESTLSLRCLYSPDRRQAQLSIVVSELCPGRLSEEERQAHFARQLQHLTPHLFAETIRIHANLQLAELLLGRLQAQLAVVPLTSYSCEICLTLPTD